MSQEDKQINPIVDVQRNRMKTAFILERATDERDLLQIQIKNLEESVSAKDPFCQLLIENLRSERHHRLVQRNASLRHLSERNTYSVSNSLPYQSTE